MSFHGASYRFGPIRLEHSPSRPSSRTSVAVRPIRRRAWRSAAAATTAPAARAARAPSSVGASGAAAARRGDRGMPASIHPVPPRSWRAGGGGPGGGAAGGKARSSGGREPGPDPPEVVQRGPVPSLPPTGLVAGIPWGGSRGAGALPARPAAGRGHGPSPRCRRRAGTDSPAFPPLPGPVGQPGILSPSGSDPRHRASL